MKVFLKIIFFGILNCAFGQNFYFPTDLQYQPRSNQPQFNQNQFYPHFFPTQNSQTPYPYQTSPYLSHQQTSQNPATSVRLDPSAQQISAQDEERSRLIIASQRIASEKCEEYKKLSGTIVAAGISTRTSANNYVHHDETCDSAAGLVVGGILAQDGDFPHMAAIGYKNLTQLKFDCGGSLISENFIITAAHCKYSGGIEASFVRLGCTSLNGPFYKDVDVESFMKHDLFSSSSMKNDIALIKLKTSVNLISGGAIRPACLWTTKELSQKNAIASGWGVTSYGGSSSDVLLKVKLDIFGNKACTKQYPEFDLASNTQICVGDMHGTKDTCQGDSGGPLQIIDPKNKCVSHIVGITSYGTSCGLRNSRAVYTRISSYIDWIVPKVWEIA